MLRPRHYYALYELMTLILIIALVIRIGCRLPPACQCSNASNVERLLCLVQSMDVVNAKPVQLLMQNPYTVNRSLVLLATRGNNHGENSW